MCALVEGMRPLKSGHSFDCDKMLTSEPLDVGEPILLDDRLPDDE